MLSKEEIVWLKKMVKRVDVNKALREAEEMGIEVCERELGFHGIYNKQGELEVLNLKKYIQE